MTNSTQPTQPKQSTYSTQSTRTQHTQHTALNQYIITVKLPNNPQHDPKNKIPGICPLGGYCSDVTGAHHSTLAKFANVDDARKFYLDMGYHVTRIEKA